MLLVTVGGVAQLGERCVRNAEVGSSILLLSTTAEFQRDVFADVPLFFPKISSSFPSLTGRIEAPQTQISPSAKPRGLGARKAQVCLDGKLCVFFCDAAMGTLFYEKTVAEDQHERDTAFR